MAFVKDEESRNVIVDLLVDFATRATLEELDAFVIENKVEILVQVNRALDVIAGLPIPVPLKDRLDTLDSYLK